MKKLTNIEKISIDDLSKLYKGKTIYKANNPAYTFDLLSDTWQVDLNAYIHLAWMRKVDFSTLGFVMLRRLIAFRASNYSTATATENMYSLKRYSTSLENHLKFQAVFHGRSSHSQPRDVMIFNSLDKDKSDENKELRQYFSDIISFVKEQKFDHTPHSNFLDPYKGGYSEIEYTSAKEKLRLATDESVRKVNELEVIKAAPLHNLSVVVAMQLMIAIVRRPTQLAQLKWIDVLPVGVSFGDHRDAKSCDIPQYEHLFSDVEQLHLRTFRGKNGEFRLSAELRSHRLEPNFSTLILFYRQCYERVLRGHFHSCNIYLSTKEWTDLMFRCPLFPQQGLFYFDFENKANVFKALTLHSKAWHKSGCNLTNNFTFLNERLNIESDRIAKVKLSNNRVRHTILSKGANDGLSEIQIAKITGVTLRAVKPYIDFNIKARLMINDSFAEQKIFKQFGSFGVQEIQQKQSFKVVDEFDEELGVIQQSLDCSSCQAKLGIPVGCYGCDNFRPRLDADHRMNLEKAERKLALNQESGNKVTLKKLLRSIVFIRASIIVCDEMMLRQKGLLHEY